MSEREKNKTGCGMCGAKDKEQEALNDALNAVSGGKKKPVDVGCMYCGASERGRKAKVTAGEAELTAMRHVVPVIEAAKRSNKYYLLLVCPACGAVVGVHYV